MRFLTTSVLILLLATPLAAQDPQPLGQPVQPVQPEERPEVREREQEHVVRRGDTLWDLAGQYLANPFRWPLIFEANPGVVRDPHWIYPEQVLVIPGLRERFEVWPAERRDAVSQFEPPPRTVFYREPPVRHGDGPTVLVEPLAERVPVKPGEFYAAEFLALPALLPVVARVIRPTRHLEQAQGLLPSAHPHDDLYVSYEAPGAVEVDNRYLIAEVGRRVPEAGSDIRIISPRAIVRVTAADPEVMRVTIDEQFDRVVRGHVILPLEFYPDFMAARAEPVAEGYDLEGRILAFVYEGPLPGLLMRAFLSLGAVHGVRVGDIFEAHTPERSLGNRRGERVPVEPVAILRVVRVDEGTSTVVVDEVMSPQLENGIPVRRVRKMP